MENISAVSIKIDGSHIAWIYPSGTNLNFLNDSEINGKFSFYYAEVESNKIYFEYKESELNINSLRLKETVRYCCKVENCSPEFAPHITNEDNNLLKLEREDDRIIFQFINYLGKSFIYFGNDKSKKIEFEVVPDKINYEDDYIELTKALADECSTLLLDYSSPTSLTFLHDPSRESTVLEQFIFLRTFCYSDNLESIFAAIKRNPDRILVKEDELKHFGNGFPSSNFFSNPFSNSRNWIKSQNGNYLPAEISVSRKYDSFDTSANRFVKFALNTFSEICRSVIEKVELDKSGRELKAEAQKIISIIDDILYDSFFDDVNELEVMPVNNQVLEKREGYSQIFNAFSMADLALHLDWKGKDDVYSGESKNTALLYEYWLFFELRKILFELSGREIDSSQIEPYNQFVTDKNGLTISLRQGNSSIQTYKFENLKLTVNLYYNRTFSPVQFNSSVYWGSYSRPFRPDYTIAIFPDKYSKESKAIEAGDVSYIHFDAKYRIQDLTKFINSDKKNITAENFDTSITQSTEQESRDLIEEKNDSVMNTYKRGDLLKMHTYNDAIRRTVGSYVLYPGNENNENRNEHTSIYDELLPGVGAFAIRPGNENAGHNAIKDFIVTILKFKSKESSRQYRKDYFENMVIQSPSDKTLYAEKVTTILDSGKLEYQMIGFIRNEYLTFLLKNCHIPNSVEDFRPEKDFEFYFYFYAIKSGKVYTIHKETNRTKYLRVTTSDIKNCKAEFGYKFQSLEPWEAEIETIELVSKGVLKEKLDTLYGKDSFVPVNGFNADYYYLAKAKVTRYFESGITAVNATEDDDISAYSPKIIPRIMDSTMVLYEK